MEDNVIDDDLLNDLNDLEDESEEQEIEIEKNQDQQQDNENNQLNNGNQQEIQDAMNQFAQEFQHDSKEVSYLMKDKDYVQFVQKVENIINVKPKQQITVDCEEYHYIKKANELGAITDREIQAIHKHVKDSYQKKFAELEKIVLNAIEYVKCVQIIQNQIDYNSIDFSKLLTSHQMLAIHVAGSSSIGEQLSQKELDNILKSCDTVLQLDEYKSLLLNYVENRMKYIAPNLSKLVGTQCASKLMGAAGGIDALSRMPACNIQVMGSQKKALLGFSKAGQGFNRGYFGSLEFVQKAPAIFQTRLVRMLSTNVAKCARIDFLRTSPDGSAGKRIKELMLQRFDKIQEPGSGKLDKPLPKPDDKAKPKRGGKRYRKMKERMQQTELQKAKGRLTFGEKEETEIGYSGVGIGQLTNQSGQSTGKIKLKINKNQQARLSKKNQQRLAALNSANSGGTDSGIASSIAFTPVQGMELVNPQKKEEARPDNYFNKEAGFRTVVQQKKSLLDMLGPVSK